MKLVITAEQKLEAITTHLYCAGGPRAWKPKPGMLYTILRNDLELYEVVGVQTPLDSDDVVLVCRADTPDPMEFALAEWNLDFGTNRIPIPDHLAEEIKARGLADEAREGVELLADETEAATPAEGAWFRARITAAHQDDTNAIWKVAFKDILTHRVLRCVIPHQLGGGGQRRGSLEDPAGQPRRRHPLGHLPRGRQDLGQERRHPRPRRDLSHR